MKTVWCLFSIENNYDQPRNNLEAVWLAKPTIKDLKSILKETTEKDLKEILAGEELRLWNYDYRLQQVLVGIILE